MKYANPPIGSNASAMAVKARWLAGSGRGEDALRGNRDDRLGLKPEVLLGR